MSDYIFPNVPNSYNVNDTITFNYTGDMQSFTPNGITRLKIECYGAQGGSFDTIKGGNGGYTIGELNYALSNPKMPDGVMHIAVGGSPTVNNVTIDGTTYKVSSETSNFGNGGNGNGGCAGGGATDVRVYYSNDYNDSESLNSRIIVAGGGGGTNYATTQSVDGNGKTITTITTQNGADAGGWTSDSTSTCSGASQTAGGIQIGNESIICNGSFGKGGSSISTAKGSGGGGGFYGGAAGNGSTGGSSYIAGNENCPYANPYGIALTNSNTVKGENSGDGKVVITILELTAPIIVSPPPSNPKAQIHLYEKDSSGTTQTISLYQNTVASPKLVINNNNTLYYAKLSTNTEFPSNLRVKYNGTIYTVCITGDPDYNFSLNGLSFRDGGSFPGTVNKIGIIKLENTTKLKLQYHYYYRANEPRGGSTGTAIAIDSDNNNIITDIKSSAVSENTFDDTATITLGAGEHPIYFCGYKPKYHGIIYSEGYLKVYLL
jgi:hypothetical protein